MTFRNGDQSRPIQLAHEIREGVAHYRQVPSKHKFQVGCQLGAAEASCLINDYVKAAEILFVEYATATRTWAEEAVGSSEPPIDVLFARETLILGLTFVSWGIDNIVREYGDDLSPSDIEKYGDALEANFDTRFDLIMQQTVEGTHPIRSFLEDA